ncbi:MBL fold metallo-hydrolase [Anaerosinus massiliensis]|uniref:MBL fold metallo-hydrolase n=1 Tax=Massilibacillus massiliensis TaxID=1806837 RepID=UPI000A754152|nr:MBL fold metallo-hydrolase [Massilibacillus massiliensis]
MQVHVLASGSKGNSTYIQIGDTKILVDAGISARRIKTSLASIGVAIEELNGILITHEHRDHISGLPTLTKKYQLPIYTRADTFQSMYCRSLLSDACCNAIGDKIGIGELKIECFNIPHDAADPIGFNIFGKDIKCTFATDLGFVTSSVQKALDHSDILILEANHDVELLRNGAYPSYLKQRILSNRGHLSNADAAWALVRMKKQKHMKVFLAHLSEENNRPNIAWETVQKIISAQGEALDIRLASQNEVVSL